MALPDPTRYLPLNPFVEVSVEEKHLLGCVPLREVREIHSSVTSHLNKAFDSAHLTGSSQCCLLVGVSGSGKTHQLARLRQIHANSSLFAYLPYFPASPATFIATVLLQVMRCLDHPARTEKNEAADFTQLQKLAYALLKRVVEQDVSLEQLHESWLDHTLEERQTLVADAITVLKEENSNAPPGLIAVLLSTLLPERRSLATQWLGGSAYATTEALALLGVEALLPREDHLLVLEWLGHLAQQAKLTLVLAMDDWDLTSFSTSIEALPRLLTCLLDRSRHWITLITLNSETSTGGRNPLVPFLPEGCASLDEQTPNEGNLWFAHLKPLTPTEQWMLLSRYLDDKSLTKQRKADWIASSLHPFSSQDILELTGREVSPRQVLTEARQRYQSVLKASSAPPSLQTYIRKLFHDETAWAAVTSRLPSAAELGEGCANLLRLITKNHLRIQHGNLKDLVPEFDGTDWRIELGHRRLRLVTSHATGPLWDEVVETLQQETAPALLCRYAKFPILEQTSRERLAQFQSAGHAFHWVDAAEWHAWSALSKMLRSFHLGRLQDLRYHPALTPHHYSIVLRKVMAARHMPLVQVLRSLGRGPRERQIADNPSPSAQSTAGAVRADLVALTQSILQEERWIGLARLQRHLEANGMPASPDEINAVVASLESIGRVSCLPSRPAQPQYLLWTHEA